jgi:hypothetical protein
LNQKFAWEKFIREIFADFPEIVIEESELILVDDLNFIGNVSEFIQNVELDADKKRFVLKNFFGLLYLFNFLNQKLDQLELCTI